MWSRDLGNEKCWENKVIEKKCLKCLVGEPRINRVWNDEVSRRARIVREFVSRVDQRVIRCLGYIL